MVDEGIIDRTLIEKPIKDHSSLIRELRNKDIIDKINRKVNDLSSIEQTAEHEVLNLMLQNEQTIYAYWELTNLKKQIVEHHYSLPWNKLTKYLKLYDITSLRFNTINEHGSLTFPIQEEMTHLFIPKLDANKMYIAEYGVSNGVDPFFPIIRSNQIETPNVPTFNEATYEKLLWEKRAENNKDWKENFSGYTVYDTKVK